MKKLLIPIIILTSLSLYGQERATLNTPIVHPSVTDVQVTGVSLTRPKTIGTPSGEWSLNIIYYNNNDEVFTDYHQGVVSEENPNGADVLVKALNKANLSTRALNCRALDHLISEGKLPASTVTCTPQ